MKIVLYLLGAYLLGNLLSAVILSKFFYKKDIRELGSGNAGARNIGGQFGAVAFVLTFIGDAGKGALVLLIGKWLGLSDLYQLLGFFAVVLGHIFPVLFRFKGGKGIATFLGGALTWNPLVFAVFLGVFLVPFIIFRSLTVGGLIGIASYPIIMIFFSYKWYEIVIMVLVIFLIIFAFRHDIKEKLAKTNKE